MGEDVELGQGLHGGAVDKTPAVDESHLIADGVETVSVANTTPPKTIILRAVGVGVLTLFTLAGIIGFRHREQAVVAVQAQPEAVHHPSEPAPLVDGTNPDLHGATEDVDVEPRSPKVWLHKIGSLVSAGKTRLADDYKEIADKVQDVQASVQTQADQLVGAVKNDKFLYRHRRTIVAILLGLAALTAAIVVSAVLLTDNEPLQQLVETVEDKVVNIITPSPPAEPKPEPVLPVSLIVFLCFVGANVLLLAIFVVYKFLLSPRFVSDFSWTNSLVVYSIYCLWILCLVGTMISAAVCLQPLGLVSVYVLVSVIPVTLGIGTYIAASSSGGFLDFTAHLKDKLVKIVFHKIPSVETPQLRRLLYIAFFLLLGLLIPLAIITPFYQLYDAGFVNVLTGGLYATSAILTSPWSIYVSIGTTLALLLALVFIFRPQSRPKMEHVRDTILDGFRTDLSTAVLYSIGIPLSAFATVFFGWPMTIVFAFFFLLALGVVVYNFALWDSNSKCYSTHKDELGMKGLQKFCRASSNHAYVEMIVIAVIGVIVPTVLASWQTSIVPVFFSYATLGFAFFSIWRSKHLDQWKDELTHVPQRTITLGQ